MTAVVERLLELAGGYLAVGALFAVAFHVRALRRLDPAAAEAGVGFRMLITPGVIALWPLLALRWRRAGRSVEFPGDAASPVSPRTLRAAHRLAWQLLMVLVPAVLAAALWWRPRAVHASQIPVPSPEHRTVRERP